MVPRNEIKEEGERRKNSKETRAHLEAMFLRTKPEANQWLHLTPRIAALGADAFERGAVMIRKIHAYLVKEVRNAEEKSAEFVNRVCQVTLETFWSQNMKREEGFDSTDYEPDRPRPFYKLPFTFSISDKKIPPSSRRSINR